ncbi:MAG: two-component regulator propeller domain-containing protein [Acidobacteriota bacterium]
MVLTPWSARRAFGLVAVCLCMLSALPTEALSPDREIDQYSLRRWGVDEGLPMDSVLALLLSKRGYLWVGTQEGVARFDGVRFRHFDRATVPSLPHNQVSALEEGADGALWFGTERGLLRYGPERGEQRVYGVEDPVVIRALLAAADGTLWVGTQGGAFRIDRGGDDLVPVVGVEQGVRSLAETRDGTVWLGTVAGLVRAADGVRFTVEDGLPSNTVETLHASPDGGLWIGTNRGLARWRGDRFEEVELDGFSDVYIHAIREDRSGQLWVGTKRHGLLRLYGGEVSRPSKDAGPVQVRAILEDADGGLWIAASTGGGLLRLSDGPAVAWGRSQGVSSDRVFSVLAEEDGVLWIGTFGGGLNRLESGDVQVLRRADGLPSDHIWSLCRRRDGSLWVGTYGAGVARIADGRIESIQVGDGPEAGFVRALVEDPAGRLWVGTRHGIFRESAGGAWVHLSLNEGLPGVGVVAALAASDGTVYVAGYRGVARWRESQGRFETLEGTAGVSAYALAEGADGALWIGTEDRGLGRYDGAEARFLDRRSGLFDDLVYAVVLDGMGGGWVSSNRGIARVDLARFEAVLAGAEASLAPRVLGLADGLPTTEMNGGANSSGSRGPGGRLWFPSPRGAVAVDPRLESVRPSPPMAFFESVFVDRQDRTDQALSAEAVLEPGWRDLEVRWTAPSFTDVEQLLFRYRLDGHDAEWTEVEGDQRRLHYSSLPAGHYRFRLQAGYDGAWGPEAPPIRLLVASPWWQTPWALGGFGLAFAVGLIGLFGAQRRRYEQQREAAARERAVAERLRELDLAKDQFLANTSHELRTPLYGIVGLAESLLEDEGLDGDTRRRQLEQIAISGRRLGGVVGDIVDFAQIREGRLELNLGAIDIIRVIDSVLTVVEPLASDAGLELRRRGAEALPPARVDERRLQQILFNLLGNAIKFTDSGSVEVTVQRLGEAAGGALEVSIRDTGIGIEQTQLDGIFEAFEQADASNARRFGGTGLGLSLTRHLVEMHGGRLSVASTPDVGSTFRFTVPVADGAAAPAPPERAVSRPRLPPSEPPPVRSAIGDELEGAHVLVVDDEPILRLLLEAQLEAEGYRVTAVDSGAGALELLDSGDEDVDLVVLDVMMPSVTGYEVCRALRRKWEAASLPILLLTAKDRLHDLVEGFAAGANDYLIKPVGREELVARVGFHLSILETHRRQQAEIEGLRRARR